MPEEETDARINVEKRKLVSYTTLKFIVNKINNYLAFYLYCEIRILRVKLMKTEFVIGSNLNKMKVAIKSFLFSSSIYIFLRFLPSFIIESLKSIKNHHDQGNKF